MAIYKVVEVTQLDCGLRSEGGIEWEGYNSAFSDYCPAGWEIVSTRLLADNSVHRALLLLKR